MQTTVATLDCDKAKCNASDLPDQFSRLEKIVSCS